MTENNEVENIDISNTDNLYAFFIGKDDNIREVNKKEDVHPSILSLFPKSRAEGDLRLRAWAMVIYEIVGNNPTTQIKNNPVSIKEYYRTFFRGYDDSLKPYTMGYQRLTSQGTPFFKRIMDDLIDNKLYFETWFTFLLLTGLSEPGILLSKIIEKDNKLETVYFFEDMAKSLFEKCKSQFNIIKSEIYKESYWNRNAQKDNEYGENFKRPLSMYLFMLVKSIYDRILDSPLGQAESSIVNKIYHNDPKKNDYAILDCVPILTQTDKDSKKLNLWQQYNAFVVTKRIEKFQFKQNQSITKDSSKSEVADEEIVKKAKWPYEQMNNLRKSINLWQTTGMTNKGNIIDNFRIMHAQSILPEISFDWQETSLSSLSQIFAKEVADPTSNSHLVCLVGPYGTGKTTITQRLFDEVEKLAPNQWKALSFDPVQGQFVLSRLFGSDIQLKFRQSELTRILLKFGESAACYLAPAEAPGDKIIVNINEMNAGNSKQVKKGLLAIESILRDLIEKYLPSELIIFVSFQSATLAQELKDFFKERPDLVMGKARLSSLWVIRGDCIQYKASNREKDDDPMLMLLEKIFPEANNFVKIIKQQLLTPLTIKMKMLYNYFSTISVENIEEGDSALKILSNFIKKVGNTNGNTNIDKDIIPIDEWLPSETEQDTEYSKLLNTAFYTGIGSTVTTQITLWNGFIRQFLEMARNEAGFLLSFADYAINKITARSHQAKLVENLCKYIWNQQIPSLHTAGLGGSNYKIKAADYLSGSDKKPNIYKLPENLLDDQNKTINLGWGVDPEKGSIFDGGFRIISEPKKSDIIVAYDIVNGRPKKKDHSRTKGGNKLDYFEITIDIKNNDNVVIQELKDDTDKTYLNIPVNNCILLMAYIAGYIANKKYIKNVTPEKSDGIIIFDLWIENTMDTPPDEWYAHKFVIGLQSDSENNGIIKKLQEEFNAENKQKIKQKWEKFVPKENVNNQIIPTYEVKQAIEELYLDLKTKTKDTNIEINDIQVLPLNNRLVECKKHQNSNKKDIVEIVSIIDEEKNILKYPGLPELNIDYDGLFALSNKQKINLQKVCAVQEKDNIKGYLALALVSGKNQLVKFIKYLTRAKSSTENHFHRVTSEDKLEKSEYKIDFQNDSSNLFSFNDPYNINFLVCILDNKDDNQIEYFLIKPLSNNKNISKNAK